MTGRNCRDVQNSGKPGGQCSAVQRLYFDQVPAPAPCGFDATQTGPICAAMKVPMTAMAAPLEMHAYAALSLDTMVELDRHAERGECTQEAGNDAQNDHEPR